MRKSHAILRYPNERTKRIDELVTKIYDMKRQNNGVDNNIMGNHVKAMALVDGSRGGAGQGWDPGRSKMGILGRKNTAIRKAPEVTPGHIASFVALL